MVWIICALIVIALVAVFSAQNAAPVVISFVTWKFEASLAIVIFLSVLAGVIIATLFTAYINVKRYLNRREGKTAKGEGGSKGENRSNSPSGIP